MGVFDKLFGRRRATDVEPPPLAPAPPAPRRSDTGERRQSAASGRGVVLVRSPDGAENRVPIGVKPITIGRWAQCDIVLDDETIRPVHVRVSALDNGGFRIHGIAAPSLRPYATNVARPDEWMLAHTGDEVKLGDYVIQFLASDSATSSGASGPAQSAEPTSPPPEGGAAESGAAPEHSPSSESPSSSKPSESQESPSEPDYPLSP